MRLSFEALTDYSLTQMNAPAYHHDSTASTQRTYNLLIRMIKKLSSVRRISGGGTCPESHSNSPRNIPPDRRFVSWVAL